MIARWLLVMTALVLISGTAQAARVSGVWISEVLYDPAGPDSSNQKIELVNTGATATALGNWAMCIQFLYKRFPSGSTIAAGGRYTIHLNKLGVNNATNWYTGAYVNIDAASDAISMYHTFSGFTTAANMEDFVQFGAGGQPRENVAVAAGLWTTGAFVPRGAEGQSVQFLPAGAPPALPHPVADYCNAAPTIDAPNACGPTTGSLGDLRITEVLADPAGDQAGQTRVELVNGGALPVDLMGLVLCSKFVYHVVPSSLLVPAGGLVVLHLNEAGVSTPAHLYTGPGFGDLEPLGDSFSLYANELDFTDPANLLDFVQWGAAGQPREDVAALKGIWTAGQYVPEVIEGSSIQWRGTNDGNSPDDFCADVPTLGSLNLCTTSGLPGDGSRGAHLVLRANFPNPFARSTRIGFVLSKPDPRASLVIYDLGGRPVRTLLDGPVGIGALALDWDGLDDSGRPAPGGLYFYRLTAGGEHQARKMILLRD